MVYKIGLPSSFYISAPSNETAGLTGAVLTASLPRIRISQGGRVNARF